MIENPAHPSQLVGVPSTAEAKSILREQIRARLKAIPAVERATASAQLRARLATEKFFADATTILFFAPLPDEPDIWPLLAEALTAGKTVALPRFDSATQSYAAVRVQNLASDIVAGQFGIREPSPACPVVPLNQLDLWLVPGVAFDPGGRRLGRGKGFYDRLLASACGTTCGVAFDEQIVPSVPVAPHDVCLNHILTPSRWHTARPARF